MGNNKSKIPNPEFEILEEKENYFVAKKREEIFIIKKIPQKQEKAISDIEILKATNHPHIVDIKNSFTDGENNMYVVMESSEGGNFATKIKEMKDEPQESEVLSWMAEIFMALKTIHDKELLHKNLSLESILLTEFGIVRLGGFEAFQKTEKSSANSEQNINYFAPEVFKEGSYDMKSDIWSVGCILFEICSKEKAFCDETPIVLIPKVISGPCPTLPEQFSPELHALLNNMLQKDRRARSTADEILAHPIFINCLIEKCNKGVKELEDKLKALRGLADGLERINENTTIGSLAGGVIGAAGGITSIVGLILAPFTLGASLIVTGVGVGVSVVGGIAAGASNITKMVNQSSDRKAVNVIIKEFEQKINAVVAWLQQINDSFQTHNTNCPKLNDTDGNDGENNLASVGLRAAKGLGNISELIRLTQVINFGKIAAQTARAVRVAEVATGVLSGLFVAVDVFFIAMDAKEIHNIKQAKAAESSQTEANQQQNPKIKSEIMRFVKSVREAADNLEGELQNLQDLISSIPSLQAETNLY